MGHYSQFPEVIPQHRQVTHVLLSGTESLTRPYGLIEFNSGRLRQGRPDFLRNL